MSKSITEKELAEKLRNECDINRHNGWNHAARKIAEAMGITLTPEKPEPGTWHVVLDGLYVNRAAYVNGYSTLLIFADNGDYDGLPHDDDWPNLAPARVVPEAEYQRLVMEADLATEKANAALAQLSEAEVGAIFEGQKSIHLPAFATCTGSWRASFTATVNAALAKHGHGRVDVSWEHVRTAVDLSVNNAAGPDERDRITDAIMELLAASK